MPHLRCYYKSMHKLKLFLITLATFIMIAGCQTIKQKTDAIVEKENES